MKGLPRVMAAIRASRAQAVNLSDHVDLDIRAARIAEVTAAGVSNLPTATEIGNALYELDVLKLALSAAGIINIPTSEGSVGV